MEEILHHLGCIKPCEYCDIDPTSTGAGFLPWTVWLISPNKQGEWFKAGPWWQLVAKDGPKVDQFGREVPMMMVMMVITTWALTKPTKKTVGLSHFPLSCIFVLDEIDFGEKKQTNIYIYIFLHIYIYTMQFSTNNSPFEECIVQKQIWGCSSRASNMDWFSEQQRVISRLQWLHGFVRFWEQVVRRSHISNHPSASLDTYQVFIAGSNGLIWFFTTFFQSHGTCAQLGFSWSKRCPFIEVDESYLGKVIAMSIVRKPTFKRVMNSKGAHVSSTTPFLLQVMQELCRSVGQILHN